MLKFNTKNVVDKISYKQLKKRYQPIINNLVTHINVGSLDGSDMMGWIDLIDDYDTHELLRMREKANQWQKMGIKTVLVIGIGGSYVGVRAAIDMCTPAFAKENPEIIWLHNISSTYISGLIKKLKRQKFAIVVISKSGTTLEPALGFRIFREILENTVGINASHKYIVAITDYEKGTLHDFAKQHNYAMFGIRNNIGGRFSTLTPVGMFPMILKGLDPLQILKGAKQALLDVKTNDIAKNSAYLYACYRHYWHNVKCYQIENFIVYDPNLAFVSEMWKQIFGESEGKKHRGLYPTISLFTTDLHSMGQFLQEGTRNFFETTLMINKPKANAIVKIRDNDDGLRYLNNKSIDYINKKAFEGTIAAHTQIGKVNNLIIELDTNDAYHFGYLFIWLATTVTISGYLLKINPFNQPGVEQYKTNMFKLLGKRK